MKTAESEVLRRALAGDKYTDEGTLHAHQLIENITEARANGYDLACPQCGVGIYDDSDAHEEWCPTLRDT